jgi:predicted transcriptional regulator
LLLTGEKMKINQFMKKSVISIKHDQPVSDAITLFVMHPIGILPVIDRDKRLVGILALKDILHLIMPASFDLVEDLDFLHDLGAAEKVTLSSEEMQQPVTNLMSPPISAEIDFTLLHAAAIITKHSMHDLPVIDHDEKLIGLLSHVDIGRGLLARWHHKSSQKNNKE